MHILVIANPDLYEMRRFRQEARRAGFKLDVVRIEELEFDLRGNGTRIFLKGRDISKAYDILYLRYFFPYISEGLFAAEWAAAHGLRVFDRALVDRNLVKSKVYDYWKLKDAGLPVPKGFQVMRLKNAGKHLKGMRWPIVAKGVHGGKGRYVYLLEDRASAKSYLNDDLIGFFTFQDRLEVTAEYRVVVIGGKAVGVMRKAARPGDFRANIAAGASGEKAEIPKAWLRMCEKAAKLLDREFAGVDLAIAGEKPYILEVNRTPAFEGFEKATGVNVAKAYLTYVTQNRHRRAPERR